MLLATLVAASAGCRFHIDTIRDNTPKTESEVAALAPGRTAVAEALAVLGAPDGVAWLDSEDALVYTSSDRHTTRWSLDNPAVFVNRITPQGVAGEVVGAAVFAASRTGGRSVLPSRPPRGRPVPEELPEIMGGFGKPLKLNGERRGEDQVWLFFDRDSGLLTRVEVQRSSPSRGTADVAGGTFLH